MMGAFFLIEKAKLMLVGFQRDYRQLPLCSY